MKRVLKFFDFLIIFGNLIYKISVNNFKLGVILLNEQKGFCVYIEYYIGFDDVNDIEYFNLNLKDQSGDDYYNWYKVKYFFN